MLDYKMIALAVDRLLCSEVTWLMNGQSTLNTGWAQVTFLGHNKAPKEGTRARVVRKLRWTGLLVCMRSRLIHLPRVLHHQTRRCALELKWRCSTKLESLLCDYSTVCCFLCSECAEPTQIRHFKLDFPYPLKS